MDLDEERAKLGIPEYSVGTQFRRVSDGVQVTVYERGGYVGLCEGRMVFVRVVDGQSRICGYVYKCREPVSGEQIDVYGDEIGREFELVEG